MTENTATIETAEFSPKIKTYTYLIVSFYLLISVAGIAFLPVWLLGFGQWFSKRYYKHLRCKLTDRHLNFKKGVLFKVEKTIPLENIQDLTFIENPILNLLELKILKIETAGHSNPQGSDMKLVGIIEAAAFRDLVLRQREVITTKSSGTGTGQEPGQDEIIPLLKEIKDILVDIKNK